MVFILFSVIPGREAPGSDLTERKLDSLIQLHKSLYQKFDLEGNSREALSNLKQYQQLSDSLESFRLVKEREIKKVQYKNDQKELQFALLKKQDELIGVRLTQSWTALWGSSAAILLATLVILLVVRQRQLKTSRKTLKVEQYLLLSQMNPHFILNTLANIQSFIVLNDLDKATRYLSGFAAMAANILESAGEENILLNKEIGIITCYLEIQKVRFGNKFTYSISVADDLDPEKALIPPMLSQPFIENAIDHGIRNRDGKGMIRVRFSRPGKSLLIEIEDDGVGRAVAKELNSRRDKGHHGMTMTITEERLKNMGSRLRGRGKLEITDLLDSDGTGRGTLVRIEVPIS